MLGLGTQELLLILLLVLVIFGAGKLPQIGTSLGKAIRNFKKGMHEEEGKGLDAKPKEDDGNHNQRRH